jgi:hypothetical protein
VLPDKFANYGMGTLDAAFKDGRPLDKATVTIAAPIAKVENTIAKAMKRGRKLLSAVVFSGGKIEEVHRSEEGAARSGLLEKAKAAVTVAQPTIGCPVPEFERAEIRATRVLREFLTPRQLMDFETTQGFVVQGADTGHRYMLVSRHSPLTRETGGRSVYDVTEGRPVCVHDWSVPASEELLELALFLTLPGHEKYVRSLPEA